MADLIERDATHDAIGFERCDRSCTDCPTKCTWYYTVKNIPAVNRWIACSERFPEPLQTVIVCTDIKTVTAAWLNGDHWTFADTGNGHTEKWSFEAVKYWMPLPEPPKEGADHA